MPRPQAREGILAIGRVLILKVSSLAAHCLFIRVALAIAIIQRLSTVLAICASFCLLQRCGLGIWLILANRESSYSTSVQLSRIPTTCNSSTQPKWIREHGHPIANRNTIFRSRSSILRRKRCHVRLNRSRLEPTTGV